MLQFHAEAAKPSMCRNGVQVGNKPEAVTVDDQLNRTFVANRNSDTVSLIGPDDGTDATITVGIAPVDIKYDRSTNLLYVANSGSDNISVIDPTTDYFLEYKHWISVNWTVTENQSSAIMTHIANKIATVTQHMNHEIPIGVGILGFMPGLVLGLYKG